ncbi:MAG: hypothetical protein O7D94_06755 [Planctomycetota bacterium]|nr:hypothetical protein [Planctomycetota bacterium]
MDTAGEIQALINILGANSTSGCRLRLMFPGRARWACWFLAALL